MEAMTSLIRRSVAALCCAAACVGLAGCTPPGRAVGDTQDRDAPVAFDGLDRGDVVIGYVGSDRTAMDSLMLDAFASAGLKAVYVPCASNGDPAAAAQGGVEDMAFRQVSIIMVARLDAGGDAAGWDDALSEARRAGIPVVLLDPLAVPDDDTLFAATFTVNDRAADATAIDDAVMTVIDDRPHEREMMVTTFVDDAA